ncbi:MAG: protein TolR [Luteitalea sp.]|nr:protein TolR [Luteitalea sp.]
MSMDLGGAKGGVKADINVTPLVDVMLVLLIIVMLIAPMVQAGANVTLPQASNIEQKPDTQEQTTVLITASGEFYVDGQPVAEAQVLSRIMESLESKPEHIVYLKADRTTRYAAVMEMMDRLREAEIEEVGLITEQDPDAVREEQGPAEGGE